MLAAAAIQPSSSAVHTLAIIAAALFTVGALIEVVKVPLTPHTLAVILTMAGLCLLSLAVIFLV
jgi:hypothetical protein